jgi:hypothetical protein
LEKLWAKEHKSKWPNGLPMLIGDRSWTTWVEEALGDREAEYAQRLDSGDEEEHPWVFTIAGGHAYLFYLTSAGGLETVILGPLLGGEYREEITDAEKLNLSYVHPRLPGGRLVLTETSLKGAGVTRLRGTLRAWAETPTPPFPRSDP